MSGRICIAAVATAFITQAVPSSHTSGEVNNYKSLRDVPTLQLLPPTLQVSCSRQCLQADNVAYRLPKKYAQCTQVHILYVLLLILVYIVYYV